MSSASLLISLVSGCGYSAEGGNEIDKENVVVAESPPVEKTFSPGDRVEFTDPSDDNDKYFADLISGYVLDSKSPLAKLCKKEELPIQYLEEQHRYSGYKIPSGKVYCVDQNKVFPLGKYENKRERDLSRFPEEQITINRGLAVSNQDSNFGWALYMFKGDPLGGYVEVEYTGYLIDRMTKRSNACSLDQNTCSKLEVKIESSSLPNDEELDQVVTFYQTRPFAGMFTGMGID